MLPILLLAAESLACGGMFCNSLNYSTDAINQAAEEILFAVDEQEGKVTTHVKIFYEGPADSFAWVVPVPSQPELGLGSNAMFEVLKDDAEAHFAVTEVEEGCAWGSGTGAGTGTGTGTGSFTWGTTTSATVFPGVDVIAEEAVGPYETVILQADNSTALTAWLINSGFDIPPGFDPAVAPYVAQDQFFVAMRLAKDNDVGDLEPIVMTYDSGKAGIPLTLTSVAAVDDMRLRVYVLGEHRAVPENYLHVVINGFAIDWWRDGDNYEEVVALAADEAGGQAFATDYVGSPSTLADRLFPPAWANLALEQSADAYEFLVAMAEAELPVTDALQSALDAFIAVPGVTSAELYACPSCYEIELRALAFDAVGASAEVDAYLLDPREQGAALFEAHPTLTRLTSSASPHEMTIDPFFVFNPDMAQSVGNVQTATVATLCEDEGAWDSPRELRLPDGQAAALPALADMTSSEFEALSDLFFPTARIIEKTSASGLPEVVVDNSDMFDDLVDSHNGFRSGDPSEAGGRAARGGCGCATGGPSGTGVELWLLALALRRRTR